MSFTYFVMMSKTAASYERAGNWREATVWWSRAAERAHTTANRRWAEDRAEFCARQYAQQQAAG